MKLPVAGDIGCYNLGTLPPFNAQHTMGSMGASVGVLHGMGLSGLPEPAVCTIGDGTFFHAGVAPLLNMVHNKGKGTVIIMDNRTTAMTGHQDNPGIEATLSLGTVAPVDIAGLCRACGVEKVLTADAFDPQPQARPRGGCGQVHRLRQVHPERLPLRGAVRRKAPQDREAQGPHRTCDLRRLRHLRPDLSRPRHLRPRTSLRSASP